MFDLEKAALIAEGVAAEAGCLTQHLCNAKNFEEEKKKVLQYVEDFDKYLEGEVSVVFPPFEDEKLNRVLSLGQTIMDEMPKLKDGIFKTTFQKAHKILREVIKDATSREDVRKTMIEFILDHS